MNRFTGGLMVGLLLGMTSLAILQAVLQVSPRKEPAVAGVHFPSEWTARTQTDVAQYKLIEKIAIDHKRDQMIRNFRDWLASEGASPDEIERQVAAVQVIPVTIDPYSDR